MSGGVRVSKHERKRLQLNPLTQAIESFLSQHEEHNVANVEDVKDLPKRYTVYEPMLLLPSNFVTHSSKWQRIYSSLSEEQQHRLFAIVISTFNKMGQHVTHVAMNAPIALSIQYVDQSAEENTKRAPCNLQILHGDFGPSNLLSDCAEPSNADFSAAFWVSTSQVPGVKQVWAPRWTMFSRGNISEKARILGAVSVNSSPFSGLIEQELGEPLSNVDVVDMYVGIGYFAIPYLKRGVRRVLGWEINGWSVEALRRGCELNNFRCEVIKVGENTLQNEIQAIAERVRVLIHRYGEELRCIVFLGDNRTAMNILTALSQVEGTGAGLLNIRHCNLGLLPSSQGSWRSAVHMISSVRGGWIHVHENAEIKQVDQKKLDIDRAIRSYVDDFKDSNWHISCEHTEMVKTYAPGIGHFVFDIKLMPPGINS